MTNEASAEAMLAWIMPCKEEFGDSQMTNEDFEERSDDLLKKISFNHFQSDYQSGFLTFLYIRLVETSTKISAK